MINLKPITPDDYLRLKPFFNNQSHRLCIYGLPSLLSWRNTEYHPCAAIIDGVLMIAAEFNTQKDKRHLILPVSGGTLYPPERLHELAGLLGFSSYWFVPQDYIDTFGTDRISSRFLVAEQPEYADYVYYKDDLANLTGRKYARKRNLISQFKREFLNADRVQIEPLKSGHLSECQTFMEEWCLENDCDMEGDSNLACEKQAVINTIMELDRYDSRGLLVRIDSEICAFGIGARLTNEMGVLHFEKAFARYKGLYQFFDRLCAQTLFDGLTYINKESDMAVPNLEKAKQSYYPIMRIRSYSLTVLS
ncbi:MAG: phosphatidylglycerol lysyltransferase domain-containing protein [Desulfatirhabdiaceae bacterium]